MPKYPYCVVEDVEARLQSVRPGGFSTTTKPTLAQVKTFMDEWAAELRNVLMVAKYDLDNLAKASGTASGVSGATVTMKTGELIADADLAIGDDVMLQGVDANGARVFEYGTVKTRTPAAGSGDVTSFTLSSAASESYSGEVTVLVVNDAWRTLRRVNADAVAMQAEFVALAATSPNQSDHVGALREVLDRIEKKIKAVPAYLHDAARLNTALQDPQSQPAHTFYTKNTDDVTDPFASIDMEF